MKRQCAWYLGLAMGLALAAHAAPPVAATPPASAPTPATSASAPLAPASALTAREPTASAASASTPATSEAASVRIVQARAATPNVAVYLDIRSERGSAVSGVKADQIQAEIGPYRASTKSLQSVQDTGEGVAYIFLVDVSKSLKPEQFAKIRTALLRWAESLGEKDRAAIVTFGESVKTAQDFTADKAVLKTRIDELALTDVHTRLHDGLIRALDLGRRQDAELPRRRVIVTLTDGVADVAGGSTRDETMARIKEEPVPIYAIGYAAATVPARARDEGFKTLGAFAHASGGAFVAAGAVPLDEIFAKIQQAIGEAYLLVLDCATCPGDGRAYPLHIRFQADSRVLTAVSEVRLVPGPVVPVPVIQAEPPPKEQALPLWLWVGAGLGVAVVFGLVLMRRKKIAPSPPPPAPEPVPVSDQAKTGVAPVELASTARPMTRPGIRVQLTAVSGSQRGREWVTEVGTDAVIGRSASCAVIIDDDGEISARNSVLSSEGGLLFVEDLGSTNGTSINGSPIKGRRRVGDGDLILVGRTELRLTLPKKP